MKYSSTDRPSMKLALIERSMISPFGLAIRPRIPATCRICLKEPRAQPGDGGDDYSAADMPPFMTPVLEELMRQAAKEREAQREQAGEEPPPGGELDADKAMQTTEAQLGERDGDDAAQRGRSSQDDAPAAPGEAPDALSDDQEGG